MNHILALGLPIMTFENESDWTDKSGKYECLYYKDLHTRVKKMLEEKEMPHGTRVHIIRIWSDGFMAHHVKIDSEYNNIQLFTLSVLASEDGNAKHHTIPFALGFNQKGHSTILNQLLQEIQRVGVPTERYYGQDKHPFHPVFFLQIVSNNYPERCANTVLANLGTFTHRWGYSGKYNGNVTPSCQKCELGRV